jgi:serine/threonine-protein kinase
VLDRGLRTLVGRYELHELLATGGMGQVWRGRDVLLGRPVAIKVLRSEYTGDATFRARFRAEAQHAAMLVHRNIAAVFDYGEAVAEEGSGENLAYLVMELVEGEPLSSRLTREVRLGVPETLDLLHQTACALAAAHAAGVVHRDVKPGNVLLGRDGVVKITDFGIAWSASDVPLTQTGQVVGTAHYLSPEQADGGKASPASDVYALGMIAYECLAGRRAFDGDNAVQIALRQISDVPDPLPADVPDPVRSLVGRALLKDPAARYADGAAFCDAVAEVLAGREPPGPPAPLLPVDPETTPLARSPGRPLEPRPHGRGRWRRAAAPLATLAAGAVIGIGALQLFGTADVAPPAAAGATGGAHGRPAPATIDLVAADWIGRPVDEVRAGLTALGLRVTATPVDGTGRAAGTVTAIDPLGRLVPGDTVTVGYATAPPASPSPDGGSTAAQPEEVALSPAAATEAAQAPVAGGSGTGGKGPGPAHGPEKGPPKPHEQPKPGHGGPGKDG